VVSGNGLKRILVVNDTQEILAHFRDILESEGCGSTSPRSPATSRKSR